MLMHDTPCRTLAEAAASLPHMEPGLAAATRGLYGRALAVQAAHGVLELRFQPVAAGPATLQFGLRCGDTEWQVQLIGGLALAGTDLEWTLHLAPTLRRAAFVHATLPLWDALTGCCGSPVELVQIEQPVHTWTPQQALGGTLFSTEAAGTACSLLLQPSRDTDWAPLVQALQGRLRPCLQPPALELVLGLRPRAVPLALRELAALAPGDVLLLDAPGGAGEGVEVGLFAGEEALPGVRGLLAHGRLRVVGAAADATHMFRRTSMTSQTNASRTAETASAPPQEEPPANGHPLDAVQVDVDVELARVPLPLASLRTLAVGQVIETTQPLDTQDIVLWCGGRYLGRGQLVTVGSRLGVRVVALVDNAASAETAHG